MNFNVIKLFVENKFTEIANAIYGWWCADMISRYWAIYVCTIIPATIINYFILMGCDPEAAKHPFIEVIFVAFAYYSLFFAFIGLLHAIVFVMLKWISSNIELAQRGIKVKAKWKKDGV